MRGIRGRFRVGLSVCEPLRTRARTAAALSAATQSRCVGRGLEQIRSHHQVRGLRRIRRVRGQRSCEWLDRLW